MNILVAPDKFKGSLTANEVCDAIEQGLLQFDETLTVNKVPLADGGEGSMDILEQYLDLQPVSLNVDDPLGRSITATYQLSENRAYIEMAAASGLHLLKEDERDCLLTSSYGTGQMILDAYNRGVTHIYLFVGGSATNDAGMGILSALGIKAVAHNQILKPIGGNLLKLTGFDDTRQRIPAVEISFTVVCDVKNPIYGFQGAAYVYAPQKGADADAVVLLDQGLRNFAQVVSKEPGIKVDDFEGAGAAGGVAAGIKAFFPINIQSGIEAIIEIVGLEEAVAAADLVITGEGKFDRQTLEGKVVMGVHNLCKQFHKRMAVICGTLDLDTDQLAPLNIWKVSSLVREDTTMEQAIDNAFELVSQRALELLDDISPEGC